MNTVKRLAKEYVDFLDKDSPIVSRSHLVMRSHLYNMGPKDSEAYHAEVKSLLKLRANGE